MDLQSFNLNARQRFMANLVHADLSKDLSLCNIEPQYDCGVFYLKAQNEKNEQLAYIPISTNEQYNLERITDLQEILKDSIIYTVFVNNTNEIMFYNISIGINEEGLKFNEVKERQE